MWVRACGWGGEEVYWCGPLWLWEELAPWRGLAARGKG